MPRDEVETLLRDLGAKGLEPILKEKNIPPELLTLTEEGSKHLADLNFREYKDAVGSLGLDIGEHTPGNFWWTLRRADLGVVQTAEHELYEIDIKQFLEEYADADTRDKKIRVMDRHSINLIQSKEYLSPAALIRVIESGDLAEAPNVGKKMLGMSVELANHLIRTANQASQSE
jgi:hypothetical protein